MRTSLLRFDAPLDRDGGAALARALPTSAGLYALSVALPDGRDVPLRVGIAAGAGGLRERICIGSSSHYASVCSPRDGALAAAYPNYWHFFKEIGAIEGARTTWTVLTCEAATDLERDAWAKSLRGLERRVIDLLQPVWEQPALKSMCRFSAERPQVADLIEQWWGQHGRAEPWVNRFGALVDHVSGQGVDAVALRRVTLELSPDAAAMLSAAADDERSTMSELVERLVRREYGASAAPRVRGQPTTPVAGPSGSGARDQRRVADLGWAGLRRKLEGLDLKWNMDPKRGTFISPATGRALIKDLNISTLKGYAYPPPTYRRPAYARVYRADNAINIGELTVDDFDALMAALGFVPKSESPTPA